MKHRPLAIGAVVLFTLGMIAGFSALGYVIHIAETAPALGKPINRGLTSSVYAANGQLLGYIQADEISTPVAWKRLPQNCKDATVAIEDQRFYQHGGVDYTAIVRAAVRNATSGKTVQGGSTITMQLVRNLYIEAPKRDFKRKIREAKMASDLESEHSKTWILDQYLNTAPYGTVGGQSAMGMQAAAQTFFAKNAKDLDLSECATLAGLPQAPTDYNPFLNPAAAITRRNEVLTKMAQLGYISQTEADQAIASPLRVKRGTRYTKIREPYFFDYVKQQLIDKYGINTVRKGGLRVYTTIDPRLQVAARSAIDSTLVTPGDPSSAIVATDPRNGYVRAMASSGGYGQSQFNLAAQGSRQPGSSFKTMVLLTALNQGINPNSTTYNSHPIDIKSTQWGEIKVATYSDDYQGTINLVRATLTSDNSVYIQLDLDVGPENVKETARKLGIRSKLNGYPAEGIGGLENGVSPMEMSHAYATLAAGGVRTKQLVIKKVDFPDAKEDSTYQVHRKRVFSDGVVYELTKILEQNVDGGTATGVRGGGFTCPAAAKTGTTDNFRDAWLVGYTPTLATATWMGYPNQQKSMQGVEGVGAVAGGTLPTTIWTKFMKAAIGNHCRNFPEPKNPFVSKPFSGKYAAQGKEEGAQYDKDSDKKYTEGKKKPKSNGGGGNDTTTDTPDTQAPVESPGGANPGQ
ncbi:MAG: transglycosylase domain-containing protein [Solirubrobacterales bacterium]